jgi:hypothetical protein
MPSHRPGSGGESDVGGGIFLLDVGVEECRCRRLRRTHTDSQSEIGQPALDWPSLMPYRKSVPLKAMTISPVCVFLYAPAVNPLVKRLLVMSLV